MKHLAYATAILLWTFAGCSSSSSPTSPSVAVARATYTVSGVIAARTTAGSTALDGVRVASNAGPTATTDTNGFYSLPGLYAINVITASKSGYVTGTEQVIIVGDTRLDIELARVPSFTLSGVVFEETPTGRVPVDKVQVYCDACGEGHLSVDTDSSGVYRFLDVLSGTYPILVHKTGYDVIDSIDTFGGWSGRRVVTVNGDTQFDIQVRRR